MTKLDTRTPTAAARSLSGIEDMILDLNEAQLAGADPRVVGRLEGLIAATPCETLADAHAKAELLLGMLDSRPGETIESDLARTIAEFLRTSRDA